MAAAEVGIEECEGCGAHISWVDAAYACGDAGCTFCSDCADERGQVCPNCSGTLAARGRNTQPLPK